MLFVALARGAGLDARYQIVDMPPDWSSESEFVVIRQHINALVRSSSMLDYVVDFNQERAEDRYRKRIVDDDHALSLFYNNLGTEALIRKDFEPAFLYLRESVRVSPRMTMPWINLGALYSRAGLPDRAEAAYLHALALDPTERSALNNLATLHAAQGEQELAEAYQRRVRRYQLTNPYYRYALAQRAYAEGRFDDAVGQTRKALRLKREEPNFYVLLGSAYLKMGRGSNAASIFERGRDYLEGGEALARYDAEIRALTDGAAAAR
jgi:Flp pilus assembly protein TadD